MIIKESFQKRKIEKEHHSKIDYLKRIASKYNDALCYYILKNDVIVYRWLGSKKDKINNKDIESLRESDISLLVLIDEIDYKKKQDEIDALWQCPLPMKKDAELIREYIETNGIKSLFHFTDVRNLPSIIKNGGLYSWSSLLNRNILVENPGGGHLSRSLDSRHHLEDYVRLSFTNGHPMMYRKQEENGIMVLLFIHPAIMLQDCFHMLTDDFSWCHKKGNKIESNIIQPRKRKSLSRLFSFVRKRTETDETYPFTNIATAAIVSRSGDLGRENHNIKSPYGFKIS